MIFPDTPELNWKEEHLQEHVATFLDGLKDLRVLDFHHAPLEGKRSGRAGAKLKRAGMKKGHPDFDIYLPAGRTLFVELKTLTGRVEKVQIERHEALRRLGFPVHVVRAATPARAVKSVEDILRDSGVRL